MNQQLFSIGTVSRIIGVARHKINYAVANGSIPEPIRIANRRAFSIVEAQQIADYFGVEIKIGDDADQGEK